MIWVTTNSATDTSILFNVDIESYYILRIKDSKGTNFIANIPYVDGSERYIMAKATKAFINSLTLGENTYYLYKADDIDDLNWENKEVLEQGLIKVIEGVEVLPDDGGDGEIIIPKGL